MGFVQENDKSENVFIFVMLMTPLCHIYVTK